MKRDRAWVEFSLLNASWRSQLDMNRIEGEPEERQSRHTPPLDFSGELWLPGVAPIKEG